MRCVFHAMAGFLGRVDNETRCAFWAEEPVDHGFDPGRLIAVDLARTPKHGPIPDHRPSLKETPMTSHAPTPSRPTRPCTADLLAAAELPATTAGPLAAGPKLPPYRGD